MKNLWKKWFPAKVKTKPFVVSVVMYKHHGEGTRIENVVRTIFAENIDIARRTVEEEVQADLPDFTMCSTCVYAFFKKDA